MKYQVCVVTGTRAEFGLLHPLLNRICAEEQMELRLVVTGTHLLPEFGNTQNEILASGIPIHKRIQIDMQLDSASAMAATTGSALSAFAAYFEEYRPDLLVVLGDRYEIFAAAAAAALQNIAIAHIHGGETTEGAVDEFLRHSITKMSYLHFTACEEYRRRVIQLGESPERVYNVGALGVENVMSLPEMSLEDLSENLNIDLSTPYSIVTFHPVTQEEECTEDYVRMLIAAMDCFPEMKYIITKANADAGGRLINAIWDEEAKKHSNWVVVASLGAKRYLTALKNAKMMIGNSSSGILEAPALKVPTVNIGIRQKGRLLSQSVISCNQDTESIVDAIKYALDESFLHSLKNMQSPFGEGDASAKIMAECMRFLREKPSTVKSFYDL